MKWNMGEKYRELKEKEIELQEKTISSLMEALEDGIWFHNVSNCKNPEEILFMKKEGDNLYVYRKKNVGEEKGYRKYEITGTSANDWGLTSDENPRMFLSMSGFADVSHVGDMKECEYFDNVEGVSEVEVGVYFDAVDREIR